MLIVDVSSETDPRAAAESRMKADLAGPIEPTRGPLFGYALFKASPDRFFWYARYHHLVMDSFGMSLLAQRAAKVYTDLVNRQAVGDGSFGPLASLLEDDAAYRASERFTQDGRYWLDRLANHPEPTTLSGRSPAGSARPHGFLRQSAYLQPSSLTQLNAISRRMGTSLARIITAVTAIFLHRTTGAEDLVLSLPVAARNSVSRHIPGMTANLLPLRLAVNPGMSVAEMISQTTWQIRELLEHQRCQIADLWRGLGRLTDNRVMWGPAVNFMRFNYDLSFAGSRSTAHNLTLGGVEDLSIAVYDRLDGGPLRIDFDANPELYVAADITEHQHRFLRLLEAAVASPDRAIGSLEILAPAERHTILQTWNDTARAVPSATLPELFAAQVARTPDAVAVVFEDQSLTYGELDARANQLAHHLRALGVGPETVVGLCVERSPEMLIGLIGILKAGGAYLPLDPDYPAERLAFMLEDGRAPVLSPSRQFSIGCPPWRTHRALDAEWQAIAAQPISAPALALDPHTSPTSSTPQAPPEPQGRCRHAWWHPQSCSAQIDRSAIGPEARVFSLPRRASMRRSRRLRRF